MRTDDGADIYVAYFDLGIDEGNKFKIQAAPRCETSEERHALLNNVFAVAIGRPPFNGVRYDVYAI